MFNLTVYFLSLFSILYAQPDISPNLSYLGGCFGYGLCWFSVRKLSYKKIWQRLFIWMFLVAGYHFSWMATTDYFGYVIYIPWLLLAAFIAASFASFSVVLFWFKKRSAVPFLLLLLPAFWVCIESIRYYGVLSGVCFDYLGWSLTSLPSFAQLVSLGGWGLLSYVVVGINIAFFIFLERRCWPSFLLWVVCFSLPLGIGGGFREYIKSKKKASSYDLLHIAALQTADAPFFSVKPIAQQVWEKIFFWCSRLEGSLDLVVMPEVAVPFDRFLKIYPVEDIRQLLEKVWGEPFEIQEEVLSNDDVIGILARKLNSFILVGLESLYKGKTFYNSAVLFSPEGYAVADYDKKILVPVGEYLPGGEIGLWAVKRFAPEYLVSYDRKPGIKEGTFRGKTIPPLAVSICYEEMFGYILRECRRSGATLLVNLSNDGWYPRSRLPSVHFLHGLQRNLELGMPCVRACHTGVTAVVDSLGNTVASLIEDNQQQRAEQGFLIADVPMFSYQTPYIWYGDDPMMFLAYLSAPLVLLTYLQKRGRVKRRF